ncbi:MAG: peptidoglycan-binding domain-containing protein [Rhizonema sp. NSF051]|nr:peptidoglycan-binding domain-containing protein [Rhizonema sp. NSF051]
MKGRRKASLLSFISSMAQVANCSRIKRRQEFQSLPMIGMLVCVPLFVGLLSVVSVAAPSKIAQTIPGTPRSSINRPTLKVGSQGEPVSELQAALKLLGFYTGTVDGVYNNTTATAVSRFKQAAGLNPDGIVDASTWQKLFPAETVASSPTPSPTPSQSSTSNPEPKPVTSKTPNNPSVVNSKPEPKPAATRTTTATSQNTSIQQSSSSRTQQNSNSQSTIRQQTTNTQQTTRTPQTPAIQYTSAGLPILRKGMHGPEVVKLQQRLQRLGFFDGSIDGDFGLKTEDAVESVQKRYGLEPDGVAGGATWDILMRRR